MNRPSRIYATIDLDAVTWNLENMKKNITIKEIYFHYFLLSL